MQAMSLSSLIADSESSRHSSHARPALLDGDQSLDLATFGKQVVAAADWLRDQGIGRGDKVAVWLVNRSEWLTLLFAVARVGAALVAVNTRYRAAELQYLLERSGARLLVLQLNFRSIDFPAVLNAVDPARVPALKRVAVVEADGVVNNDFPASLLGCPTVRFDWERITRPEFIPEDQSDPDNPVILFTTSGTTSGPKLVVHSQRSLIRHVEAVAASSGLRAPDAALLAALPLCGTFGLIGVLAALLARAPVVLMDAFDGARAALLVNRHSITHVYGSDEMYSRMLQAMPPTGNPFPSARLFGYAAFQPRATQFALNAIARGVPLIGLYGSSEVHALFSVQSLEQPAQERIKGGGIAASTDAKVRVRDIESGCLAAHGVSGEIEIRAPANFIGYFNDSQATSAAIDAEGFFRTGDIGYLRPDGSFVYQTRRGDVIRLGGFLVNPTEIEDTIKTFEGVANVGVVAVELDQKPRAVAFVVPESDKTPREVDLIKASRQQMADFKVPARIWLIEDLPVTESANGTKVQRARLRELAQQHLASESGSKQASQN